MKTKIIYISGSEIFNITDIRSAFEEVRNALQLDKDTVLFGVPVDTDDAGFGTPTPTEQDIQLEPIETTSNLESNQDAVEIKETAEPLVVQEPEKRKRSRKNTERTQNTKEPEENTDKVVPILSVLSTKDDDISDVENVDTKIDQETVLPKTDEIVENDIKQENDVLTEIDAEPATENFGEPDLEKLLSAMTPLQEDVLEEQQTVIETIKKTTEDNQTEDVDATLEQLATEFAETQDKILSETKSSSRSKIGKLRNILPFKQSKHKDQGIGDLFGWAGVAANDEEFSVPGFFTNAKSKK